MSEFDVAKNILDLEIGFEPSFETYKTNFNENMSEYDLKSLRLDLENSVETLFALAKVKLAVTPSLASFYVPVPNRFDLYENMFYVFEQKLRQSKQTNTNESGFLNQEKKELTKTVEYESFRDPNWS